jgi:fused signal recognition particle receptor
MEEVDVEVDKVEEIEEIEEKIEIEMMEQNVIFQEEVIVKKGFFSKLKEGLDKTRQNIMSGVDNVLSSFTKIDEELFEELEESLIMSDIGVETTTRIIEGLRERVKRARATQASQVKQLLIDEITQILEQNETQLTLKSPAIILVIGVNGVGKTTTIGKLANIYKQQGNKVLLAAADTFRAAAIDQLEIWGQRSNIDVIKHQENSDPAAVVYDALQAAKARHTDILICDTAGRLHNKKNLMDELKKIFKVISREYPEAQKEVFLVLDGTTGQNALQQAKMFKEVADITGIVLTKLDGTAKGGIVIAIKSELNIPVRYIGVGEGINDLQEFNAGDFAKALFNE